MRRSTCVAVIVIVACLVLPSLLQAGDIPTPGYQVGPLHYPGQRFFFQGLECIVDDVCWRDSLATTSGEVFKPDFQFFLFRMMIANRTESDIHVPSLYLANSAVQVFKETPLPMYFADPRREFTQAETVYLRDPGTPTILPPGAYVVGFVAFDVPATNLPLGITIFDESNPLFPYALVATSVGSDRIKGRGSLLAQQVPEFYYQVHPIHYPGERFSFREWECVIDGVYWRDSLTMPSGEVLKPDSLFLLIRIMLTNQAEFSRCPPPHFSLSNPAGEYLGSNTELPARFSDPYGELTQDQAVALQDPHGVTELLPGACITGFVAFDVPANMSLPLGLKIVDLSGPGWRETVVAISVGPERIGDVKSDSKATFLITKSLGESFAAAQFEYLVKSPEWAPSFGSQKAQYKFLTVGVGVANKTTDVACIPEYQLVDAYGRTHPEVTPPAAFPRSLARLRAEPLKSGQAQYGYVVFDVPSDHSYWIHIPTSFDGVKVCIPLHTR